MISMMKAKYYTVDFKNLQEPWKGTTTAHSVWIQMCICHDLQAYGGDEGFILQRNKHGIFENHYRLQYAKLSLSALM